jgi:hypothetical protein
MNHSGFRQLYWGFLFVMVDFRIQGFDVLPDVIGYMLFAAGLGALASESVHFGPASRLNVAMIFLSLFSLYEPPIQGGGVRIGPFGPLGMLIGIAATVVSLLVVYHMFKGIGDMAARQDKAEIAGEAATRWHQYLMLQLATLLGLVFIFIPAIGLLYLIALIGAAIALTVVIMGFIARCGENLQSA